MYLYPHESDTRSTDHNLYVLGDRVFQANYSSGLRVLELGDLADRELEEIAFSTRIPKATTSGSTAPGAFYPYLPSGTIIVSDINNGLFVLSMQ